MDRKWSCINSVLGASTSRHTEGKTMHNPLAEEDTWAEASGHEYEVFLSFMGEDTRKKFTDHLYHRMMDAGISVFKDNVNLPNGEEIAHSLSGAIKKSKMAIPILSANYAASRWCLDELVCILECRNMRKQMVLPIFYDITPSQVRHQKDSYAAAFEEHIKKHDEKTVEKWRKALKEVSSLKGLELAKETDGHEGQLTKRIVANVLSKLKIAHLVVTNNLVGIDDQAKAIMGLLQIGGNDVRIVGIWGMGGIGKTTLAKFIYNQILDEFECCSFLKDVRETSLQHRGLEVLQTQLVFDLSKEARRSFTSTDEGINELKNRFREKKVLILLDDIDQIHQLNGLAPKSRCFGPGSRVIITTRTRDVLDVHQVNEVYEVKEMDQEDALRLFCWHAFRNECPNTEFKALSDDVVKTTGGLPLALEVIGSFLSHKLKPIWEETLHKLKRAPKEEVQERLKINYDRLDDDQKQMFLDVACLFIGEDIDVVMYVWKDRNFSAEIGIYVLLVMSLIKIGEDNRIWMHDQLRDLGREIVRKENSKEPGKRSRLWHSDEARDALEKQVIKSEVEALHLRFVSIRNNCINIEQLRNSMNIWYLHLDYADLIGDFQHLLPELRWLTWRCPSSNCTATNLNLEKLLVLDLSSSWNVRGDWELMKSFQSAKNLTVLNLTSCMKVSTLDVSMFIKLKRLILDNCVRLKAISIGMHEDLLLLSMENCQSIKDLSLCSVANLEILSLANCRSIKKLPDSIGKMKSLIELDLSGTQFPILPSSICDLENLQVLKTYGSRMCSLPNAILESEKLHLIDNFACELLEGNMEKWTISVRMYPKLIKRLNGSEALHVLKFSGFEDYHQRCRADRVIERFKEVEALQVLHVIGCGSEEMLQELNLEGCRGIVTLTGLSTLKYLRILNCCGCEKLQEIGNLDGLEALEEFNLEGCRAIKTLPSLSCLKSLRILNYIGCEKLQNFNVKNCKAIEKLPSFSSLRSLRILVCDGCDKLQELEGLDGLETLEVLSVEECRAIEKLPKLSNLTSLRLLSCRGCVKLQKIEGVDGLKALVEINIGGCIAIEKLPKLSGLKFLRFLSCRDCVKLQEIEGLDGLEALVEINLEGCKAIEKLPKLSDLKSLRVLSCCGCVKLQEIEGLDGLEALVQLNLNGCSAIEKLPSLSNLQFLKVLNCCGCEKLEKVEGLDGLKVLVRFNLERCRSIEKLPGISNLRYLRELNCRGCEKLNVIESIDGLKQLVELDLEGCRELENLLKLPDSHHLRKLNCYGCVNLQEIVGLGGLTALEELNLEGCTGIKELSSLFTLRSLRVFNCCGCDKLEKVEGIDGLEALEVFNLEGCIAIKKLPRFFNTRYLRKLNCCGCEKLIEIEGLDGSEALVELNLQGCRSMKQLPILFKSRYLRQLNCGGSDILQVVKLTFNSRGHRMTDIDKMPDSLSALTDIDKMPEILSALEVLNIGGCSMIENLPNLSDLTSLRLLNCGGCEKLREIKGLDRLEELEYVDISKCKAIRHIPVLPQHMMYERQWLDLSGCESYEVIHHYFNLRVFCSTCQLSAEDLDRIVKYGCRDYNESHGIEQLLETAENKDRDYNASISYESHGSEQLLETTQHEDRDHNNASISYESHESEQLLETAEHEDRDYNASISYESHGSEQLLQTADLQSRKRNALRRYLGRFWGSLKRLTS